MHCLIELIIESCKASNIMMHHIGHSRAADHDIDQALHACTAQLLYRIDHATQCTCMETINRARMIDNPGQSFEHPAGIDGSSSSHVPATCA